MNIEHVKNSFVKAERCSTGVACLYSVLKYWNRFADKRVLSVWAETKKGITGIAGLQKAAVYSGFTAHVCKISIEKLRVIAEPVILYIRRQDEIKDYVVCYGLDNGDFVIGDTLVGINAITNEELIKIWIDGIAFILYPNNDCSLISDKENICQVGKELLEALQNGVIKGDEETILYPIDQKAFWDIIYKSDISDFNWFSYLHYLYLRISRCRDLSNEMTISEMENRHMLIYVLDCLERLLAKGLILKSEVISELKRIHELRLCPEKTMNLLAYDNAKSTLRIPLRSSETTFVIPIRVDSEERERNLDILLESLAFMEKVHILVAEGDDKRRYYLKKDYPNVKYYFYEDPDPVFYRTKYLNRLLEMAETEIVGIWDTDVVIPERQIREAIEAVHNGGIVMSFPFDGRFCMLSPEWTDIYLNSRTISSLEEAVQTWSMPYGEYSVGGAFLVNRKIYLECGGENENFYGWGPEDAERVKRMEILGMPVFRSEGPLFHLFHPRNPNSGFATKELEYRNRKEYLKVCSMTKSELFQYIQTWPWKVSENTEE